MEDVFEISKFDEYKEDNRREVKAAEGGLPQSLWDTYSSMANTYGGVIICGVRERQDGTWYTTGMKDASKLKRNFWNQANDQKKVSILFKMFNLIGIGEHAGSGVPDIFDIWKNEGLKEP